MYTESSNSVRTQTNACLDMSQFARVYSPGNLPYPFTSVLYICIVLKLTIWLLNLRSLLLEGQKSLDFGSRKFLYSDPWLMKSIPLSLSFSWYLSAASGSIMCSVDIHNVLNGITQFLYNVLSSISLLRFDVLHKTRWQTA